MIKSSFYYYVLLSFIAFILFSGLIIVGLYNIAPSFKWIILKDVIVVSTIVVFFVLNFQKFPYKILLYITPVVFVGFLGLLNANDVSLFLMVASLRQFLIPFLFIMIGYFAINSIKNYEVLSRQIIILLAVVVCIGFIERFFLVWQYIDVSPFYIEKQIYMFSNGYPFFWIEPISIFGYKTFEEGMPRMVSTILDPVNLGHILVFAFALTYYEGKKIFEKNVRIFLLTLFFIGLLLTFSKGALLQFFLALTILNSNISIVVKVFVSMLIAPFVMFFVMNHPGFILHFNGFVSVFDYVSILGSGLGSFGNYSAMFSENSVIGVGDSYWAAVLGQFGVVGFIFWIGTFLVIAKVIGYKNYLCWLLLGQLFVAALSENTFNFMSVFLLMIFLGASLRLKMRREVQI